MKKYRRIKRADEGHRYTAEIYNKDLKLIMVRELKIDETRVRLRDDRPKWEETIDGCPGWWRCEEPKVA